MTLGGFLVLILIAAICGAIGQTIAGFSRGGCLFSVVIGFMGAWSGLLIADLAGLPEFIPVMIQGKSFPIIWSIIGAAVLSGLASLIFSPRHR